jgi:hypothetical protein
VIVNAFSARLSAAAFVAALALGTALTLPSPALAEGADAAQSQAGGAPVIDRRGRVISPEGGDRRGRDIRPLEERPAVVTRRGEPVIVNRNDGYSRTYADRSYPDRRYDRDRTFYRSGNNAYYNGHRGYRYRRDGYREYNGYWFPLAAFAAGAVIAGAMVAPPPPVVAVAPNPHVDWCARTYRSYNPYDNTFQPFRGPRQYCVSPWS